MLIALLIILVLIVIYFISCQRNLVDLKERIENSLSNIGVQQKSRFDALMQIAKVAKAYKMHEAETLINITEARSAVIPNSVKDIKVNENDFAQALSNLKVVVEAYPELKANSLYGQTMAQIDDYENKVRLSRQVYNDCVTRYNSLVKQLPSSLVANFLHFQTENYLTFDTASEAMPNLDL